MRDAVKAAAKGAREGFSEASKLRKTKTILTSRNAPTIATRRRKEIMKRGGLSGKGEEDCNKDRKSYIDKAKILGEKIMRG